MTERLPPFDDEELKELLGNTKELAFLHVPKTGGTYVARELVKFCKRRDIEVHLLRHYFGILQAPENVHVFATVRNPFDWLVSLYASGYREKEWRKERRLRNEQSFRTHWQHFADFDEAYYTAPVPQKFVHTYTTFPTMLEEFIEWFIEQRNMPVKRFLTTRQHWPPEYAPLGGDSNRWKRVIKDNNRSFAIEKSCISLSPLYQLFQERDTPQVAFILRQDQLDDALHKIFYYLTRCDKRYEYVQADRANVSMRRSGFLTGVNSEDYRDVFSDAAREMVEEHYGWELDLLGYDFEKGVLDDNPILDFRNAKWPSTAKEST